MMLVQKPQSAVISPVSLTHRRHPSAPVFVQSTCTPGLLTLSKPLRQSPSRQLPANQRQQQSKPSPRPVKLVARAQALTPAAEIVDKKQQPKQPSTTGSATPSVVPRGRQAVKQREKSQAVRSLSQYPVRGKHGRQPSPPITISDAAPATKQEQQDVLSSQAEAPIIINSSNLFEPFNSSPPPSPTISSKSSGKLAPRRAPSSKAIPVPVPSSNKSHHPSLSRSEPFFSNMRPRSTAFPDFPICDDLNDVADADLSVKDLSAKQPPVTPPRRPTISTANAFRVDGPRTAPLSSRTPAAFPFNNMELATPPPALAFTLPRRSPKKHRRVPSEGVFHMSSDEEVSTGPGGVVLNANVRALFGLTGSQAVTKMSSTPASPSPFMTPSNAQARASAPNLGTQFRESSPSYGSLAKERQLELEAQQKAAYFASSMFQNSPSPDELPDPLLL